jgi:hydrogenase nickel incorporation protein HypA/HybF
VHELSVVQALLREIDAVATANGATSVQRVTVRIGPLSGVDPGLLASAFEAARGSGRTAGTELVLESLAVKVRCGQCGEESTVTPNRLLCGRCGGYRTTLLTGDELLLQRVELTPRDHATPVEHRGENDDV